MTLSSIHATLWTCARNESSKLDSFPLIFSTPSGLSTICLNCVLGERSLLLYFRCSFVVSRTNAVIGEGFWGL